MNNLTPKQAETLISIHQYTCKYGHSPSHKELAEIAGVSSVNAITDRIKSLVKKGVLESDKCKARSLCLTEIGQKTLTMLGEVSSEIRIPLKDVDISTPDQKIMAEYLSLSNIQKRIIAQIISEFSTN